MKVEDIADFEELLDDAERQAKTDWAMGFVVDMQESYDSYGGDTYVSEKQLAVLRKIAGD